MNKKGFTLIELLVVIAIIGILSSIAIVYLGDARNKANDAKVISNITTVSTQIEVNRAGGDPVDNTSIGAMITRLGNHPCGTDVPATDWHVVPVSDADYSKVAIWAHLCADATKTWCADSDSFRGEAAGTDAATPGAAAGVCIAVTP